MILMQRTVRLPLGNRVTFMFDSEHGPLVSTTPLNLADSPKRAKHLAALYVQARNRFYAEVARTLGRRIVIAEKQGPDTVFEPRQ